jgi:hypothetical protein
MVSARVPGSGGSLVSLSGGTREGTWRRQPIGFADDDGLHHQTDHH